MKLQKIKAFELYNMDKVCPSSDREKIVVRSRKIAERLQKQHGGNIKETFIHGAVE